MSLVSLVPVSSQPIEFNDLKEGIRLSVILSGCISIQIYGKVSDFLPEDDEEEEVVLITWFGNPSNEVIFYSRKDWEKIKPYIFEGR